MAINVSQRLMAILKLVDLTQQRERERESCWLSGFISRNTDQSRELNHNYKTFTYIIMQNALKKMRFHFF